MILSFPSWVSIVDSRLRGNDGRFYKSLISDRDQTISPLCHFVMLFAKFRRVVLLTVQFGIDR